MSVSPDEVAQEVLEIVPLIMRVIRTEMRRNRTPDLSVPQFRALAYLQHHPDASLSAIAEHIGLTLPSMSKLIDGLVGRGLVIREIAPADRRRVRLALSEPGQAMFHSVRTATLAYLAQRLATLSPDERNTVILAMQVLRPIFTSMQEPGSSTLNRRQNFS
ncbi:MAG: MarR family transcriptional regulator [Chloroflexota bacterium]